MLDYAIIGLKQWPDDQGNKDTLAFLQSCSRLPVWTHRTRAHSIASRADKPKSAPAPASLPTPAPTPAPAPVDPRVAALEKQVAFLTAQMQSMQTKPASDASTAPPSTTPAPPSSSFDSFSRHACSHLSPQAIRSPGPSPMSASGSCQSTCPATALHSPQVKSMVIASS